MDVNNLFDRRLGLIIMKEGREADIQIFNPVFDNNLFTEFYEHSRMSASPRLLDSKRTT
ncbi:hypothetical protein SAMN06264348_11411 [Oceanospirillum linum]|nr:hypothetical protein SAMN04489856_11611 [Oleiphilus messinensis]SMP35820.1 hypothetical protein SAMN06264348_11411 [Oceanospirillum linum]